ncbi:MAG: MBL fold metallo-hydrolase [Acidilobaceae archaeon]|nr:MBL fold metallo-hydrolase [Acidilobaceae archaeon]MCX8165360.1 MBL fold metallo-hydrolase [Acidilobaceae archaeon]MDW7973786.1 MBL fold metallo-hydrolase [Sulfolobales archaeon]
MISVKRYPLGPLKSNCYVVESGGEVMIIDPGWPEWLDEALKGLKNVKYIIATHGHFDHVAGVAVAKSLTGALYAIHEKDVELSRRARTAALRYVGVEVPEVPNPDFTVREGDRLELGEVEVRIMETPGHTMGSISLVIPSGIFVGDVFLASQRAVSMTSFGAVFTGDTLFKGTIGRVDFAHSSAEMMRESLRKLASLPRETMVYPGHGSPTTIGEEVDNNPYLREVLSS